MGNERGLWRDTKGSGEETGKQRNMVRWTKGERKRWQERMREDNNNNKKTNLTYTMLQTQAENFEVFLVRSCGSWLAEALLLYQCIVSWAFKVVQDSCWWNWLGFFKLNTGINGNEWVAAGSHIDNISSLLTYIINRPNSEMDFAGSHAYRCSDRRLYLCSLNTSHRQPWINLSVLYISSVWSSIFFALLNTTKQ